MVEERKCRICGCTDEHACNPPCYWVEKDLCSSCVDDVAQEQFIEDEKIDKEIDATVG